MKEKEKPPIDNDISKLYPYMDNKYNTTFTSYVQDSQNALIIGWRIRKLLKELTKGDIKSDIKFIMPNLLWITDKWGIRPQVLFVITINKNWIVDDIIYFLQLFCQNKKDYSKELCRYVYTTLKFNDFEKTKLLLLIPSNSKFFIKEDLFPNLTIE